MCHEMTNPGGHNHGRIPEAQKISLMVEYVHCSQCGKRVSNTIFVNTAEELVIRAWVECPECVMVKNGETCEWTWDSIHYKWNGACGAAWQFNGADDTPTDNDMRYCPMCGKLIKEQPRTFEDEFMA